MMVSADSAGTRLATRLSFLAAGFGMACWAPLVPFTKARLGVEEGVLGLLLLCLGIGSVVSMPLVGILSARFGAKPVIIAGGLGMAVFLPLLTVAPTPLLLGVTLACFGASLGALDVAMNVHAVEVDKAADRPLLSGFHALFSVGGFSGAGLMTLFLSGGISPLWSALGAAALVVAAILIAAPRLLTARTKTEGPLLMRPRGIVLLLAVLAAVTFLVEGALLDWSALLITEAGLVPTAQGGLGYMLFSIAMVAGRLGGDRLVARIGNRNTLLWGGVTAVAGFVALLLAPVAAVALAGFLLIGFGAANIVPLLFRQAGAQTAMPAGLAVAAITTIGYAGILAGPAAIGLVAHLTGLPVAFWLVAGLLALVPVFSRTAAAEQAPA